MKILSEEKARVLSEKNGWSLNRAEGFIDGESSRRRGKPPTIHAQVGIDEYSQGFRAGYYERRNSGQVTVPELAAIHAVRTEAVKVVEAPDLAFVPVHVG